MKVEINEQSNGCFSISVTLKSGNKYRYNMLLEEKPTDIKVKLLWNETKKHWLRY